MSKMSEMEATIRELRDIASSINSTANWLAEFFSSNGDIPEEAPVPEQALTLEDVRAVLAEKSRSGHTAEIRALLQKYGANRLSEVEPSDYTALLADAEVLDDAT